MKKEIQNIIFVSVCSFIFAVGLVLSAIFINLNTFINGNSITIEINYSNCSYKYNVKTEKETLYEILSDYNEKLSLSLYVVEDSGIIITSLKSTNVASSDYRITVNNEYFGDDISKIVLTDGDVVAIDYISSSTHQQQLDKGGDKKTTYYERISIALYSILSIILLPSIAYIVIAVIKLKQSHHLANGNG